MIKFLNQFLPLPLLLTRFTSVLRSYPGVKIAVDSGKAILLGFCLLSASVLIAQDTSEIKSLSLKVVTWNIQMLPNGLAFFSKSLRKKQRVRLPWIVEYCTNHNYDIIVFQEVFDKNIKRKLKKELKISYPYQVNPKKRSGSLVSNGVLMVSRVPMNYVDHIIFEKGAHADGIASKGCTLVEVEKEGVKMQIAGTHLQAGETEIDLFHRDLQYQDIRDLLDRNQLDNIPVFVMGDMNTRKSNQIRYSKMLDIIGVLDVTLEDTILYTIDSNNYWNTHAEPIQLDYILLQARQTSTRIISQYVFRPKHEYKGVQMDLADHYGIIAEIQVLNN